MSVYTDDSCEIEKLNSGLVLGYETWYTDERYKERFHYDDKFDTMVRTVIAEYLENDYQYTFEVT